MKDYKLLYESADAVIKFVNTQNIQLKNAVRELRRLGEIYYIEPEFEINDVNCYRCNKVYKKMIDICNEVLNEK